MPNAVSSGPIQVFSSTVQPAGRIFVVILLRKLGPKGVLSVDVTNTFIVPGLAATFWDTLKRGFVIESPLRPTRLALNVPREPGGVFAVNPGAGPATTFPGVPKAMLTVDAWAGILHRSATAPVTTAANFIFMVIKSLHFLESTRVSPIGMPQVQTFGSPNK